MAWITPTNSSLVTRKTGSLVTALSLFSLSLILLLTPGVALDVEASDPPFTGIFEYPDFSDLSDFNLLGSAVGVSNRVRLTQDLGQIGGVFLKDPMNFQDDTTVQLHFRFMMTDSEGISDGDGPGADGFAFVIAPSRNFTGGFLGYEGLANSVAVEFDTFDNTPFGNPEVSGNHVGISLNGNFASVAAADFPTRLNDGALWYAWVDYNGASNLLEVRLSPTTDYPVTPVVSHAVDIPGILNSSVGFYGFTSSTGGAANDHDIIGFWGHRSGNPSPGPIGDFVRSDFSDLSDINLRADAQGTASKISITRELNQSGGAFLRTPINLDGNASFSTHLTFQITDSEGIADGDGPGADGLTLILATDPNSIGPPGIGLGYAGLLDSVVVEFDTFDNTSFGLPEVSGNHVGINQNGDAASIAAQNISPLMNNGDVWHAWIDYNGISDTLEVRVANSASRPVGPSISTVLDIPAVLGTTVGFLGFTSSTGAAANDHDLLSWDLDIDPVLDVTADAASVSASEGGTATNSGTFSAISASALNITADVGTVTRDSGLSGAWNWSLGVGDGPSGPTSVTVTATDGLGGQDIATFDYSVNNVAPTATLGNDGPVTTGGNASVSFFGQADASSADVSAGFTYSYDFDNDGTPEVSGSAASSEIVPGGFLAADATVRGRIEDKDGGFTDYTTVIVVVPPPTVSADASPVSADEGGTAANSGTFSGGSPVTVSSDLGSITQDSGNSGSWNWSLVVGDGPSGPNTVTITATDSLGGQDTTTFDYSVDNVAPTATLSNDGPVTTGGSATVSFSEQSDSSSADVSAGFTYSYDFDNDGTPEVSGSSASSETVPGGFLAADATVRGRIEDKDGGFTDYTTLIVVVPPPTVAADNASVSADEGGTASNSGTFSGGAPVTVTADAGSISQDTGNSGTWNWSLGVGDGPSDPITVTITATDTLGGQNTTTFDYSVDNVAPTATLSNDGPVTTGGSATVTFSGQTDASSADVSAGFTYSYDFDNDGTPEVSGSAASSETVPGGFLAADATVRGRIEDKDGGFTDYTTLIVVVPPPTVAADNASVSADEGSTASNTGTFSGGAPVTVTADVGSITQDTGNSGNWNWSLGVGDGPDGPTTVTITATDSLGGQNTTTFDYSVNNVAPTVSADSPSVSADEGQQATNTGSFTDVNSEIVTLSASVGTVTGGGSDSGPWSWSIDTDDGPSEGGPVTITATDDDGGQSTVNFSYVVNNVDPTAVFSNDGPIANPSVVATVSFTGQADASSADSAAGFTYSYDFDNDGTFEISDTTTANAVVPSSYVTFGDATVRGRIEDKDGGYNDYTTVVDAQYAIVDNLDDSGPGSLRHAITSGASSGETITFSPGLTGTILLTSGELVIEKDLTIAGPGSSELAVDGSRSSRVIRVDSGSTVEISDLTIKRGQTLDFGGGVSNQGTLTISDSVISENWSRAGGGGVYNSGDLTLLDVEIKDNTTYPTSPFVHSGPGGGILNETTGTITIEGGELSTNRTGGGYTGSYGASAAYGSGYSGGRGGPGGSTGVGGGVANFGVMNLTGVSVTDNRIGTPGRGGGGGSADYSGSWYSSGGNGNSGGSSGSGGGIFNAGTMSLADSTVSSNSIPLGASGGGGGRGHYGGYGGGAGHTGSGGGIFNSGTLSVESSTVSHNSTYAYGGHGGSAGGSWTWYGLSGGRGGNGGSGGGIANFGGLIIRHSTVSDNTLYSFGGNGGSGGYGGRYYSWSDKRYYQSYGGRGGSGGYPGSGAGIHAGSSLDIEHSTIARNYISNHSGGYGGIGGYGAGNGYRSWARPTGGGLHGFSGSPISIHSSILAGNFDPSLGNHDCVSWGTSSGNNLIGSITGCSIGLTPTDITGGPDVDVTQSNGGPTETVALLPWSKAVDAGNCDTPGGTPVAADQRGLPRLQGFGCDIGAFELTQTAFGDPDDTGFTVYEGDQTLTITDQASPVGVRVSAAAGGGNERATLNACDNAALVYLNAGDEADITCGSVTVDVVSGSAGVELIGANGVRATTTLNTSQSMTFEQESFNITAPASNGGDIVIVLNGNPIPVSAGTSVSLDVTAPTLSTPADVTVAATNGSTTVVNFTLPTAIDDEDPNPIVTCDPGSGSAFTFGTTTVTCIAVDVSGNSSQVGFNVTVVDTTPPTITSPGDQTYPVEVGVTSTEFAFEEPVADDNVSVEEVVCTPASGDLLLVGMTSVSCTATDGVGLTASVSFTVTLVNGQAPVADAGGPYSVPEGGTVGLDGTGSYDPDGTALDYLWDLDGEPPTETLGANPTFDAALLDGPSATTVVLFVVDETPQQSVGVEATINVINVAPIVGADNASVTVDEGQTVSNTGSFSDPVDSVTLSASVGTVTGGGSSGGTWTWSYDTTDGPADNQTVTITADDGDGGITTATFDLTVNNVAPTIDTVADDSPVIEGGSATITVIASDPAGANDPLSYEFDCDGDLNYEVGPQAANTASCSFADQGSFTVNVRVTDGDGGSDTSSTLATVDNVAPAVDVDNASITVDEGQTATNSGTFSDVPADTVTITASSGTVTQGAGTWAWTRDTSNGPAESGTVTITASDEDGGSNTVTFDLTVNNVAPSFDPDPRDLFVIDENGSVTLDGPFSDPGSDSFTVTVDWGGSEGTDTISLAAGSTNFSASHQYPDDDPSGTASDAYSATVTLTDSDGGSDSFSVTVTVNNVAPTATISGPASADEGSTHTYTATVSDVGTEDSHTFAWDCDGDGFNDGANATVDCAFADGPGVTTVSVQVTDDDTGVGTATFDVTVSNVAPTIGADNATVTVNEGQTANNTGTFADVAADTVTISASVGTVTQGAGTWVWSLGTTDGPDESQTVTITADDGDDQSTVTFDLTVSNVAPAVDAGPDATIAEGDTFTQTGSFADPGVDTWTATVDYGDGSGTQPLVLAANGFTLSHTYNDEGTFTITVAVTDSDGAVGTDTVVVTVVDDGISAEDYAVLGARKSATIGTRATVNGGLVGGGSRLYVLSQATVGESAAVGNISIGTRATAGDIRAEKNVTLRSRSTVGNVTAGGRVHVGRNVTHGAIAEHADVDIPDFDLPKAAPNYDYRNDVRRRTRDVRNGPADLAPGRYGDLYSAYRDHIILHGGEYHFERFKLYSKTKLTVDLSNGQSLIVRVRKDISFGSRVEMEVIGGDASDIAFLSDDDIHLKSGGVYHGTFIAHDGLSTLGSKAQLTGALWGERAHAKSRSVVNHLAFDGELVDGPGVEKKPRKPKKDRDDDDDDEDDDDDD